ncbi:DUF1330 domain-containing protein [Siculibacillus lacustris]|uniref:DUF1330 domain-containing protein n=1 Tax=Siculibacillus lacustris TaxID=1549641 RepID=A0A4V2KTN4_9HYPH|nr:DUF1330 domain-containing protein [Siculibacillus lacustris]TBW37985.1 DUF1330 domain-containing protein [Siculibacillus lacustris]
MSVWFSATLRIHDSRGYDAYLAGTDEALAGTGGVVEAVDDGVTVLEGRPADGRRVLIRFPDEAAFRAWYDGPLYRRLRELRFAAAEGEAVLIHGR